MKFSDSNFISNNWLQFIATVLLLGALGEWSYGYYQLVRWVVLIAAGYTAWRSYENKKTGWTIVLGLLAILFNPIAPFYLEKETWKLLDLAGAVVLFASSFISFKKHA